jgi:ribonucleotide reductase alpha subunit
MQENILGEVNSSPSSDLSKEILSDIIIYMKYSRYIDELKRRESWEEICDRNIAMHISRFPQLKKEIIDIYTKFVKTKKVLPSMRSLQFGGKPIEINNSRIYNCTYMPAKDIKFFSELMFLLLGGSGCGYSVQKHHIEQIPIILAPIKERKFVIEDSIAGWADAIKVLLKSYTQGTTKPIFDYAQIRAKGVKLITAGGLAPGPAPLRICLTELQNILDSVSGRKLKSIEVHQMACHIADAVLAGGIRRASLISFFDMNDIDMLTCKSGDWWELHPEYARCNNSAVLERGKVTYTEFKLLWERIKESGAGEPGIIWVNNKEILGNPCQTAWAKVLTPEGIREFKDINIGSKIWSKEGWTTVINKQPTGIKPVYKFETTSSIFYGTEDHRIVSKGKKIKVKDAESIESIRGNYNTSYIIDPQDIIDGLVIGDGTKHEASGNLILLHIGENDKDYFNSEISNYIVKYRPGIGDTCYKIQTTIESKELPKTFERRVPTRYITNPDKLIGFLRGLYSANGSICGNRITLKSSSKGLVEDVQLMLSSIGIRSYYTTNLPTKVKFKNGEYLCKQSYDINITSDREKFKNLIGFIQEYKNAKIKIIPIKETINSDNYNIVNIEFLGNEEVFDITVDNNSHTYWTQGCNVSNCLEISLQPYGVCNLTEINSSTVESQEDLNERCKAAAFIGTLQASYTDFYYLREIWKKTAEEEALLGVSMTGLASNKLQSLNLQEAAQIAVETNKNLASILGINPAKRITTIKPAGTTSLVLGCSSGIHAYHAPYYLRRMRVGKNEPIYKYLKENLPNLIEDDYFRSHDTAVISIPQRSPENATLRDESALGLLERSKDLYMNWVIPGHIEGESTHNISITVSVKDNEWDIIGDWMWTNKNYYNGIAVLPYDGGTYKQAPFEECTKEVFEEMYSHLKQINLKDIIEETDNTTLNGELACSSGSCEII